MSYQETYNRWLQLTGEKKVLEQKLKDTTEEQHRHIHRLCGKKDACLDGPENCFDQAHTVRSIITVLKNDPRLVARGTDAYNRAQD